MQAATRSSDGTATTASLNSTSNLQDDGSSSLPKRQPSETPTLLPAPSTTQHRVLPLVLHQIEAIAVSRSTTRRQGSTWYTLDVYTRLETDMADSGPSEGREENREPAYRLEKTLVDFDAFRDALYSVTHSAHTFSYCEFCKEMVAYTATKEKRPSGVVTRLLGSSDKVVRSLERFVNNVAALMASPVVVEGEPWCSGHVQSRQMLRRFLLPQPQELREADSA
ncbi:hypothetical protein BBJ28_00001558 [Nothophytophthora sp. Chile5]|nr:hypothetical protein BBJ28_00001558 [Nothophytophthora sp. Chile5]